jgi:TRAP transporter 4TM/12TM fusion protein
MGQTIFAMEKSENLLQRYLVTAIAVAMSIYHLNIAYTGGYEFVFQRSLAFLFGMSLIFLTSQTNNLISKSVSFFLFLLTIISIGYPVLMTDYLNSRLFYVDPLKIEDYILGSIAILLTLEITRRTINTALPLIVLFFLVYTYFGSYFPWEFAHKGASFKNIIDHQFLAQEGLWNLPLGVFSVYIFLFILFGSFLDRMGAADYYVRLSMAAAGHLRGGPAKAAIFASAMTGSITGSANANVATTGPFTIPMMKKGGFKPEIAAGIETAASTGGQIMPPIMGASAFLIVEFTGISYWEVVKVSILPAVLYFLSVYTITHLEARKEGLKGTPRAQLESVMKVLFEGWYFLLPPIIIVFLLMQGQGVPFSGVLGIVSIVVLSGIKGALELLTQYSLKGITTTEIFTSIGNGVTNIIESLEQGAIRSLPVCAACGAVGIIMGALFQTGLGLKFSSVVIALAGDNLFLAIIFVAIASFVLGMGLPTSAAYIVLSVMAVPALLELGEPYGLSLLAAHLIVFWFSLDSCFTPPVCLPAYTAAGIAQANPNKAAWAAFRIAKGMYIIPVMFAFTPLLLLDQPLALTQTFVAATIGFLALSAAIVGHMYVKVHLAERLILCAIALGLFWPLIAVQLFSGTIFMIVFISQRLRFKKRLVES